MKNSAAAISGLLCLAAVAAGSSRAQDLDDAWAQSHAIIASAGKPRSPVEFVAVEGGTFAMGIDDGRSVVNDARPVHEVALKTFELSATLVTVEQYAECVIDGACTQPGTGDGCNWGRASRRRHPINCVDWDQANQFAAFKGARLPSEAEFEYAATSGGKSGKYPWGDEDPTCDRAVMSGENGFGCGANGTMPVCSKPAGNTASGLCDMTGNVWEWMQDAYRDSYAGAPADGRAFEAAGSNRSLRGGSFSSSEPGRLRASSRGFEGPGFRFDSIGFRLARSSP